MTIKTMVNYESYGDSLIQPLLGNARIWPAAEEDPAKSPTRITGHGIGNRFAPSVTTGIPPPDLAG